jgi:hypothetical protein
LYHGAADFYDLVGNQSMCIAVHFLYRILIRRFYQAKDGLPPFVYPIGHAFTTVIILVEQVFGMSPCYVPGLYTGHIVHIHVDWHTWSVFVLLKILNFGDK